MDHSAILDLGGNTSTSTISTSHLGAGSPRLALDGRHSKRARHDENPHPQVSALRDTLHGDVASLLKTGKVGRAYAFVYADTERLCMAKRAEQALLARHIFSETESAFAEHVAPQIAATLVGVSEESCVKKTARFLQIYEEWDALVALALQLFLYLDRTYLLHHPKHPCIRKHGTGVFVNSLVQENGDPLKHLLAVLWRKRQAHRSDVQLRGLLGRLIAALGRLDPQEQTSAHKALQPTIVNSYAALQKQWLKHKATYVCELLASMSDDSTLLTEAGKSTAFVRHTIAKLKWTHLMADLGLYLDPSLPRLVRPENFRHLEAVRRFCDTSMADYGTDATKVLLVSWGKYVQARMRSLAVDPSLISNLLALWDELHIVCDRGFNAGTKKDAFEYEVRSSLAKTLGNKDVSAAVVLQLLKFCDGAMKQASRAGDLYAEAETKVLTIFKLIPDKKAFISVYEKDLSKRLLMAKNVNFALERRLVDALVSVVGEKDENFNLRAMLRDYADSRSAFSSLALPCMPHTEFSALVLEKKVWPDIPGFGADVRLPSTLSRALAEFGTRLPEKDQKHKKLDWNSYTLHQITLSTMFATGPKELQVNLLQATVLMLFEDVDKLGVVQMLESTRMPEKLLKRVLASLSTEKYPVLQISNSTVAFNHAFSDRAPKIKLPMSRERDVSAAEEVRTVIENDRAVESRAVLVTLMKRHKCLLYTELLGKAIGELTGRGTPLLKVIKAQIEDLIEKEYIARDAQGLELSYIP